jgi:hypothetical protein
MMDVKPEDLTAGERRHLEHARAAKGQLRSNRSAD